MAPESSTGRALENAYKYSPNDNVTRQISKLQSKIEKQKIQEANSFKKRLSFRERFFSKMIIFREKKWKLNFSFKSVFFKT